MASIQTHNVKHSLRAGANKKASQRQQQQAQAQGQAGPSCQAAPSPSSQDVAKKAVFKQALGSPLTVNWPNVAAVDAQPILYTLLDVLRHKALHPYTRTDAHGKDKGLINKGQRRKARKVDVTLENESEVRAPSSSSHPLVYGINAVTRRLEKMIADRAAGETHAHSDIDIVLVCRSDLDPPKLVAHIPLLACSANAVCFPASRPGGRALRVVPLPEGAEALLADALGVRRCGAVALSSEKLPLQGLMTRIEEAKVAPLRASWLDAAAHCALNARSKLARPVSEVEAGAGAPAAAPATSPSSSGEGEGEGEDLRFEARPNVISVATTAPVNLNAVKLAKKHTRQEKKEWRKAQRKQSHQEVVAATKRNRRQRRAARGQGAAGRTTAASAT